jgi:AraC-like DNA-binding protein
MVGIMGTGQVTGHVSELVHARTAAPLRPFVAFYSGYRESGAPPMRHRGLPSPYLTVIVTLDDPLYMAAHADPRTPPGAYDTLVGGLHVTPAIITHDGCHSGVQLAVSPLGARALFGLPAGELVNVDVDATAVLGPFAATVRERIRAADTWAERFAVLDALLLDRLSLDRVPRPEVVRAWRVLNDSGGAVEVRALAEELGWSERYLNRQFAVEIGLSPKASARVVRFDRARRLLAAPSPVALAELAVECGYYDQAHLTRDFNAFAGCSPTVWLREEFRNVQALGEPELAQSAP